MSERAPFEAWSLPSGVSLPRAGERDVGEGSAAFRRAAGDAAWIERVVSALRGARAGLGSRGAVSIARVLGAVGARFLDPADPLRQEALARLPAVAGLSPEMSQAVLDGMARDWTPERLESLLHTEFGDPAVLDGFTTRGDRGLHAVGPALCVQIVAGSVPGVGVTALLRSLLVKGPTLLKPGAGDVVLPVLFHRGLHETDPELADAAAVVYWPGGSVELEVAALRRAEVAVVYGDDHTIGAVRRHAPATARLVEYRHRVSVVLVGREALTEERSHRLAAEVAGAVAFFDQRGCVSPHAIFVEEGGEVGVERLAREVARALSKLERNLPPGAIGPAQAATIHQVRGSVEMRRAAGEHVHESHEDGAWWTVIVDPGGTWDHACAGRVARLVPVGDLQEVLDILGPAAPHLQTAALEGVGRRRDVLARGLAREGVTRICALADMAFPPPWWRHDGMGPLTPLVRWTECTV